MPAITVARDAILFGAGYLYKAPLLSTLPTNTVAGGVFTDAWPVAWVSPGVTKEGSSWGWEPSTERVEVAEYTTPIRIVTTGVEINFKTELAQVTLQNLRFALNGGTVSTVSGSAATLLSSYTPAAVGSEVRSMIGWESEDSTMRIIFRQAFQSGGIEMAFRKGAENATLPLEFAIETPAAGDPLTVFTAGATRVGV